MEKKYELTNQTIEVRGKTLYRVRALRDFELRAYIPGNTRKIIIHAGNLGGYVESEENLSQEGASWVYYKSYVYSGARLEEDAFVDGESTVKDGAIIGGKIRIGYSSVISGKTTLRSDNLDTSHATIKDLDLTSYDLTGVTRLEGKITPEEYPRVIDGLVDNVKNLTPEDRLSFYKKLIEEDLL